MVVHRRRAACCVRVRAAQARARAHAIRTSRKLRYVKPPATRLGVHRLGAIACLGAQFLRYATADITRVATVADAIVWQREELE